MQQSRKEVVIMRKKMLPVVLVLLLVSMLTLTACGGGGGGSSTGPAGKYVLASIKMDDADATPFLAMAGIKAEDLYLEFLSEGKFKGAIMGEEGEGTFKVDGTKLTITVEGDNMELVFEGNKVTLTQEGDIATDGFNKMEMVFEKK